MPETVRAVLEAKPRVELVNVEDAAVMLPLMYVSPVTVRVRDAVVEPIPTLPFWRIAKRFAPVEEATENGFTPPVPCTKKVEVEVVAFTPVTVPLSRKRLEVSEVPPFHRAMYPSVPDPPKLPDPQALPEPMTAPVEVTWRHWVLPVIPVMASEVEVALPSVLFPETVSAVLDA